jgi:hypothetical protein
MERASDEVAKLVEDLPEYFRTIRPLFAPEASRGLQNLVVKLRTLGPVAVLGGETTLLGFRLPAFGPRRYDATKLAALARAAEQDRGADQLLREVSVSLIDRGEALPPEIRSQARAHIKGTHKDPPGKPGRKREDNLFRDRSIALAVDALVELGDRPTRNREQKKTDSASSIVMRALAQAGIHMTKAAVEKIWRSRPRAAPPRPKRTPRPRKHARPK